MRRVIQTLQRVLIHQEFKEKEVIGRYYICFYMIEVATV